MTTERRRACMCGRLALPGETACAQHRRKKWRGGKRYDAAYDAAYREIRRQMLAEAKAYPERLRCGICGEPGRPGEQWVVDHITPASEGGASTRDNLQLAHYTCNLRRGSQLGAKRAAERRARERES